MKYCRYLFLSCLFFQSLSQIYGQRINPFTLNNRDYFERGGVNVMAFQDIYPDGHQSGVSVIMHGTRIATNGDVRLEQTPGQWSPMPKQHTRTVNIEKGEIITTLSFPDSGKMMQGFNPIAYPDLHFTYNVTVKASGESILISVDLDRPLPPEWEDKACFILELYPVDLFGKSWYMGESSGTFPRQANGPVTSNPNIPPRALIIPDDSLKGIIPLPHHRAEAIPMASGKKLVIAPESDELRMTIETNHGTLELLDGRIQHNNGWFIVRSTLKPGTIKRALEWVITPNVINKWQSTPVLQYSQIGYHPAQAKVVMLETDVDMKWKKPLTLLRLNETGKHEVVKVKRPNHWGKFMRYDYYQFDFSEVTRSGVYQVVAGDLRSNPFRISRDNYQRDVWQPTLDYFLPVQMCHMRVREKFKLWHDLCHMDDALMAPINTNHFDGYVQGPSTLCKYAPYEPVPGLAQGGWHDAGDDDLRIETNAYELFILSAMWEEFRPLHDNTLIDQHLKIVEIHEPDGKPDILQQLEHGYLTVIAGYQALGRLYRGIISPTLSQYVLAGDVAGQTDNLIHDPDIGLYERTATHSGMPDDRLVFTEENPAREWLMIAYIASGVIAMREYNDTLANAALRAAEELWNLPRLSEGPPLGNKIIAASELFRVTGNNVYKAFLIENRDYIVHQFERIGWHLTRVLHLLDDPKFVEALRQAAFQHQEKVEQQQATTPYGVPYEPHIWGASWSIQRFGVAQYFLNRAFPEVYGQEFLLNTINFVLGCHPGSNNASFASGVGAHSMTVAYGYNRMDYSYIPGGVVSGTALIRPDFPELKMFPYLWQQAEYVMGGGATNFMFLVLAADHLLRKNTF